MIVRVSYTGKWGRMPSSAAVLAPAKLAPRVVHVDRTLSLC